MMAIEARRRVIDEVLYEHLFDNRVANINILYVVFVIS